MVLLHALRALPVRVRLKLFLDAYLRLLWNLVVAVFLLGVTFLVGAVTISVVSWTRCVPVVEELTPTAVLVRVLLSLLVGVWPGFHAVRNIIARQAAFHAWFHNTVLEAHARRTRAPGSVRSSSALPAAHLALNLRTADAPRWMPFSVAVGVMLVVALLLNASRPNVFCFQCKSKQSEAKTALKAIYTAQLAYHGEFGEYLSLHDLTTFGGLDARFVEGKRYRYRITLDGPHFTAIAIDSQQRLREDGIDIWRIDGTHPQPEPRANACENR